jgi:enoyl-CoA hydratase/carnithine racemase
MSKGKDGLLTTQTFGHGRVVLQVDEWVAHVRLYRPDKLNALDPPMIADIEAAARSISMDGSIRAVVLSGEGRAFCAGLDTTALAQLDARAVHDSSSPVDIPSDSRMLAWCWRELPVPVIAAIDGFALGAGLQIALGADYRIVSPRAQLSVLEIRWGLVPDLAGTYLLPRLVGLPAAQELTWTGRTVTGSEAVLLGLANRICEDPTAEALRLGRTIAANSPSAIRAGKRLLNTSLDRVAAAQLADEAATSSRLIGTADQQEAARAYAERRPAVFGWR